LRIGIVATHGVLPQVRYGFQDSVAEALRDALNRSPNVADDWKMSVVLPTSVSRIHKERLASGSQASSEPSTISRVHRSSENPDEPTTDYFDVHEAYWSPIDKGQTNTASVLWWLLNTIFLPLNDSARYRERVLKIIWDAGFVIVCLLLGFAAFVFALLTFAVALNAASETVKWTAGHPLPAFRLHDLFALIHVERGAPYLSVDWAPISTAFGYAIQPVNLMSTLSSDAVAVLVAGFVGAFLLGQGVRAIWSLAFSIPLGKSDALTIGSRLAVIALLLGLAFALIRFEWVFRLPNNGLSLREPGLAIILGVFAFQAGRQLVNWFLVNFFGDVQIYTTRDQNSRFYALREQILETVTNKIIDVITKMPDQKPYERVYILAHSLGSTIALDSLIRIHNLQSEGIVQLDEWKRIRGLVTFGTALEKTKYFFSAWNPTPSESWLQWSDALYGSLFTKDRLTLKTRDARGSGIYWQNCWYFSDFVSNRIWSYKSASQPQANQTSDDRLVAENRGRFGPFFPFGPYLITHTHYIDHQWFWHGTGTDDFGVLDVLTSRPFPTEL
jgi:hypothetical protein